MPPLVLASTSPRRRALLGLLGLPFTVVTPDVAEEPLPGETPPDTARRLARLKALAVAQAHADAVVIASDTVVALGAQQLAKPVDAEDAARMLRALRGPLHAVYSGVAVVWAGQVWDSVVETRVQMRDYTDAEIAAYVASGDPLDKAGAYAVQHPVFAPVARLDGCYANVVGLPLCEVQRLLRAAGVALPPSPIDGCAPPAVCLVPRDMG